MTPNARHPRTYQGRSTVCQVDDTGTLMSVFLSFGPLSPVEHAKVVWSEAEAREFIEKHGWPVPDELMEMAEVTV